MNYKVKLNRIDYLQVGLTSQNTLKALSPGSSDSHLTVIAVIGDHSGAINCFSLRSDSSTLINTIFKTLPVPNGKINCLQVTRDPIGSPKILITFGSSLIRGYTGKGKQYFSLQLNNLTEPIKYFQIIWPIDVYICGYYIYNHYVLTPDTWTDSKNCNNNIQSKHFYISPSKITGLIVIYNSIGKRSVPLISCEDRLIRILNNSTCRYELETCGVPNVLLALERSAKVSEVNFLYGTLEGKVALISLEFGLNEVNSVHKWSIPEKGFRSSVNCISMLESTGQLYIGRSDGSVEIWSFNETLEPNGSLTVDIDQSPVQSIDFNCGESLTSICICREGSLILCCTFTGLIFGLTRNQMIGQTNGQLEQSSMIINRDIEQKIGQLNSEISWLEKKLTRKREFYQNLTSGLIVNKKQKNSLTYSTLPYFTINDSFVLHQDASYLLTLESEVSIDSVIIQSELSLELIDLERNSSVLSLNENSSQQVLATFRCQVNATRFETKIKTIEGQSGIVRVYILTQMNPKSCQMKMYQIKALSLHKRNYNRIDEQLMTHINNLHIYGSFGLTESLNWLQLCLPEIPERIDLIASSSIEYNFQSTLMETFLIVNFYKGSIVFQSDNISTISIVKDFVTREATKRSIPIEINIKVNYRCLGATISKLFPKLKQLLNERKVNLIREAIKDLHIVEPEIAASIEIEIETNYSPFVTVQFNLERFYGLITDLYLDYYKLEGIEPKVIMSNLEGKLNQLIKLIEDHSDTRDDQVNLLVENLNEFWNINSIVKN